VRAVDLIGAIALGVAAIVAQSHKWPPLPKTEFVSGRAATEEDVQNGRAAFYQNRAGGDVRPMQIELPQYGWFTDEDGTRIAVVVVQAEYSDSGGILGLRDVDGQEYVVTQAEVTLLGAKPPEEKE